MRVPRGLNNGETMTKITATFAALFLFVLAQPSYAHHHRYNNHYSDTGDPRPHAWCGFFMRHHLGVADRAYNLAANWRHYGSSASGPAIGAIVVWWHHVGIITGRTASGWVILSGNDGGAVRERERSIRGAIAFRWPNGMAGL